MIVRPEPLSASVFRPFGDVLDIEGVTPELINRDHTQKFADLARISTGQGGHTQLSIYRSQPIVLPFRIRHMERHPLGSQAFFPLHDRPFPVVVAGGDEPPGADAIRVFLTNGRQGVNLFAGVWHHYQLSLDQPSDYLVIDRKGPGANFEECELEPGVLLQI